MSIVSILVLSLIALSMVALGVVLAYAMVSNFNKGKLIRLDMAKNINALRYGKVLTYFGINKNEFVHKVPLVEIEKEMRTCVACQQTKQCDKSLEETGILDDGALAFCPNTASIQNQRASY